MFKETSSSNIGEEEVVGEGEEEKEVVGRIGKHLRQTVACLLLASRLKNSAILSYEYCIFVFLSFYI